MPKPVLTPHYRRERFLRIALAFVAVLFIAIGFATPQIVQAVEYQSRGDVVTQLETEQEELASLIHHNDLSNVLIGLRVHELQQVDRELNRLVAALGEDFPTHIRTELTDATTLLAAATSELENYPQDPLVTHAMQRVNEALEEESAGAQDIVMFHAVSWFTATTDDIASLFDIPEPTYTALIGDLTKMTHSDFGAVKDELSSVQVAHKNAQLDKQTLETDLESLNGHIDGPLETVRQLAPILEVSFTELEDPTEYFAVEITALSQALDSLLSLANSKTFRVDATGTVTPSETATDTQDTEVHEIAATKHAVLLSRAIRQFIPQLVDVQDTLEELETERLRLEEIERQREAERLWELEQSQNLPGDDGNSDTAPPVTPPGGSEPDPEPEPAPEPDPVPDPTPDPDPDVNTDPSP